MMKNLILILSVIFLTIVIVNVRGAPAKEIEQAGDNPSLNIMSENLAGTAQISVQNAILLNDEELMIGEIKINLTSSLNLNILRTKEETGPIMVLKKPTSIEMGVNNTMQAMDNTKKVSNGVNAPLKFPINSENSIESAVKNPSNNFAG